MSEPGQLLIELAEHDTRIYCSFSITKNQYVYSNPAFQAFFDLKPAEATPKFLFGKVHKEDQGYLKAAFKSLKPGQIREMIEFRLTILDRIHYLRMSMLLTEHAALGKVVTGYIDDITGFKESLDTHVALSNKKNAVLNILSHDLAGPLGSIQNYSYLLSKKADPSDGLTLKMISSIEKISKRCINLIQDFVKLEFLESVGVDMVKARFNLVEIIGAFMEDYLQNQEDLKISFRFIFDDEHIFAEVDDSKFMQVLNNLISNALKFTPDGGQIEVRVMRKGTDALIVIQDTGIGIPEEFHADLFDKFSKAGRRGIKGETSVGLGMSIIKTIVEWHNGKIWFESEVNKGTTFYIQIPACE
jgi:two-component system sensor histidine kinase VicK